MHQHVAGCSFYEATHWLIQSISGHKHRRDSRKEQVLATTSKPFFLALPARKAGQGKKAMDPLLSYQKMKHT